MSEQHRNLIEFHLGALNEYPQPFPAGKAIPEWLKVMPAEVLPSEQIDGVNSTLKKCAPFIEAMMCGYVLPLACDVRFFMRTEKDLDFEQSGPVINTQPHAQYRDTPFGDKLLVKFMNPWVVKTPPGYSTLFVPLLNQSTMPFQVLAGLVETDTFYSQIHFPSICMMTPGQRFVLAKGTPIVQAIPIKREGWESKVSGRDMSKAETQFTALKANRHYYKDEHWVKKEYK